MKRFSKIAAVVLAALMLCALIGPVSFAAEAEPEYEEVTIDLSVADEEEGTSLDVTAIGEYFTSHAATGDSAAAVAADGKVILDKYAHMYAYDETAEELFQKPYTVSLNFTSTSDRDAGIYVRAINPTLTSVMNTTLGAQMSFWFYEWDWYKEHQGGAGASSTGGSGIKLSFSKTGDILLTIKTYEPDGLQVAGKMVTLAAPEGFSVNGLNPVKITDDAKSHVEIFVCDKLVATVDYSGEPEAYPDNEETQASENGVLYYKNAVVKGADGTELMNLDNARIAAETPIFAIGNRNGTTYFSDLKLTYSKVKKAATPEPTQAPATQAPTEAPATQAPAATEGTNNNATADNTATKAPDNNTGSSFPWWIVFAVCGAIVVAAIVIIIVSSKKKGAKK